MAVPPQVAGAAPGQPPANVNANMSASAACIASLRASEGQRNGGGHYNDAANNCTVGAGVLVHNGPCTAAELSAPVDRQGNEETFMARVHDAEGKVRQQVPDRVLTLDQFDSLISATFNLGPAGVAPVTGSANRHDDAGVVNGLRARVNVTHRDARGNRVGPPQRMQGVVNRREREARPFLPAPR
jgi:lysozyme